MWFSALPAQLLRGPNSVWGRVDARPGEGGHEGLLAAMLILVAGALLAVLWICLQKWRLSRATAAPEGYEEYEEVEHATEKGIKLLFLASQIAAPLGALGAFVLGEGYILAGFGLSTVILACSLATFAMAAIAWLKIARLRDQLIVWRRDLQFSSGD